VKILILLIVFLLIGGVFAQDTGWCSATMQYYFGPNCLNPWTSNIGSFYPIGSYVEFYRPDSSTDIGKVTGYSWQPERQAYAYYLATGPFYQLVPGGISGINEVVMPEFIFAASEGRFGE
jgi:hypothetical protein